MAYTKRDNKTPMPTADNSQREGGGNTPYPSGAEKHDAEKSMKIGADSNRTTGPVAMAVDQPTRQGGGNTSVTGESHDQAKAEHISEDARW
jgi:hypothetical protein